MIIIQFMAIPSKEFNHFWFISDAGYGLGSDFQDDNFARRKQRRNRTTFTLQQVNICKKKKIHIFVYFHFIAKYLLYSYICYE